MFPQSFIDQVKKATDILVLANEYTDLKKTGPGIWQGICPHPDHKDTDPSFTVWEKEQSWCCYGCHHGNKDAKHKIYGSDCFALIQWMSKGKMGWKDAILYLAEKNGVPVPSDENQALMDHKKILAQSYMHSLQGKSFNYLIARGFSKEDMTEWLIGFDGQKIIFPLIDRYRNVLGFSKRWLDMPADKDDKYRNSPNSKIFNKGYYLYGMHRFDNSFDEIRITEGAPDVILPVKYGARNVVATLGTSFTEGHAELVKMLGKTPVFCMDGDLAGLKSMKKSIDLLADLGVYSKVLLLPEKTDMADMALRLKYDTEKYILENSVTYGYFKIKNFIDTYDAKTNELKLQLFPDIIKTLKEIPGDEQIIIKEFIKNRLQMDL